MREREKKLIKILIPNNGFLDFRFLELMRIFTASGPAAQVWLMIATSLNASSTPFYAALKGN